MSRPNVILTRPHVILSLSKDEPTAPSRLRRILRQAQDDIVVGLDDIVVGLDDIGVGADDVVVGAGA
ncbi:MAG TPA: hypothetical protein VK669_15375 [Candidatus Limnocylindrales bacterium]|nr:hypothetical protein [Candidatus Limnocylindrales bacterium]